MFLKSFVKFFMKESFMMYTILLAIILFSLFLIFNRGLEWVYIPYSIFPRNFEVTDKDLKTVKKKKENHFNNQNYNLYPSWARGKYAQETNNKPIS